MNKKSGIELKGIDFFLEEALSLYKVFPKVLFLYYYSI